MFQKQLKEETNVFDTVRGIVHLGVTILKCQKKLNRFAGIKIHKLLFRQCSSDRLQNNPISLRPKRAGLPEMAIRVSHITETCPQ